MRTFLTRREQAHVVVLALMSAATAYCGDLMFFIISLAMVIRFTSLVAQRIHPHVEIIWWGLMVVDHKRLVEKSTSRSVDAIRFHIVMWWIVVVACLLGALALGARFSPFAFLFGNPMR